MTLFDYLIVLLVGLAQWAGHYAPWDVVPCLVSSDGKLRRPLAYAYGCGSIWAGLLLFSHERGPLVHIRLVLWFISLEIIAAAIGTLAPRLLAILRESNNRGDDVIDLEVLVERIRRKM